MPIPFPPAGYSESVTRRVRVIFNGQYVVDAQIPRLVWEHPFFPLYYFNQKDVNHDYFTNEQPDGTRDLIVGDRKALRAVTIFPSGEFEGLVRIAYSAADAWFEEDEQLHGHPLDPYKRIQIVQSSKHVKVMVEGVEIANTTHPKLLYETGLPVRTYIPRIDMRTDLLEQSDRTTSCPYKGVANYYRVKLSPDEKDDLIWWYESPAAESAMIKGHLSFYNEKVDLWVDGIKQTKYPQVVS